MIFINILILFVILFWCMFFMMSPMAFDAPDSSNSTSTILTLLVIYYIPFYIFAFYHFMDWSFFVFKAKNIMFASVILITLALYAFGYFGLVFNALRGVNNSGLTISKDKVFYSGKIVEGADPATFKEIPNSSYARDKNRIYYNGKKLETANTGEIKNILISGTTYVSSYWQIGNEVYIGDTLVPNVDVKNFQAYSSDKAKDGKTHYLYTKALNVDYESFKWFELYDYYGHYGIDKNNVYSNEKTILAMADTDSFKIRTDLKGANFAEDSTHLYYLAGEHSTLIDQVERKSFRDAVSKTQQDRGYFVDENYVYRFNRITPGIPAYYLLKEADVNNFQVTGYDNDTNSDANDGSSFYLEGKLVPQK